MVQLITLGPTIAALPRSLVGAPHPGMVCVPVVDPPDSHLVLTRPQLNHRPLVTSPTPRSAPAPPTTRRVAARAVTAASARPVSGHAVPAGVSVSPDRRLGWRVPTGMGSGWAADHEYDHARQRDR